MAELVKAYRRCFVARPGWSLIEVDLSQAELRISAWMARDPVMLRIYREGGDIHAATAAKVMGITMDMFNALPEDERGMARFRAKSVNFGFLYGMWWEGFMSYAKTDYGIDMTPEEAEAVFDKWKS